jgi:hypothetical protein
MARLPATGVGGRELALVTTDGLLELIEVLPAGGRRMRGTDWPRPTGHPGRGGRRLASQSGRRAVG